MKLAAPFTIDHSLLTFLPPLSAIELNGIIIVLSIQTNRMYKEIGSKDTAVCHLFLYCCFKDGAFPEGELDFVAGKFAALGMHETLNFKDEVVRFKAYKPTITDERAYLEHLISTIGSANEAALFSYCVELFLSDGQLDPSEDQLSELLGELLDISPNERLFVKKMMVQRKIVETQKFF